MTIRTRLRALSATATCQIVIGLADAVLAVRFDEPERDWN